MRLAHFALAVVALLPVISCKERKTETEGTVRAQASGQASDNRHWPYFDGSYPMVVTSQEARMEYLSRHSWDSFNFNDTLSLSYDTTQVLSEYLDFIQLLAAYGGNEKVNVIERLYSKASASRPMLNWFVWQANEVLADPNSPVRDDELCIPVLRAQLASDFYDFAERTRLEYKLNIMLQNRIGHKANDFEYTLKSGRKSRLYGLRSDFVLIFINNPGCPMCRDVREQLKASKLVTDLVENGSLAILALYPDEEYDEWLEYAADIPSDWINAYDDGCKIRSGSLYNLSAIPALYLLDKDKTVLLKDITDVALLESTLAAQ